MFFGESYEDRANRERRLFELFGVRSELAERRLEQLEVLIGDDDGERFGDAKKYLFEQLRNEVRDVTNTSENVHGVVTLALALRYSQYGERDTGVGIRPWRLENGKVVDRQTICDLAFWLVAELTQYRPIVIDFGAPGTVRLLRVGSLEGELPIDKDDNRAVPFLRRFTFVYEGAARAASGLEELPWWAPPVDRRLERPFLHYPVIVRGSVNSWERARAQLLRDFQAYLSQREEGLTPVEVAELRSRVRRDLAAFDQLATAAMLE